MGGLEKGRLMRYALLALLILSGSASAQTIVDKSAEGVSGTTLPKMLEDLSAMFADPGTVQVKSLKPDGESICGMVNAKNAFGGYVGFKPFRYIVERRKTYLENSGC